jgi:hypothetical protein
MSKKLQVLQAVRERGEATNKEISGLLGFQASGYLSMLKKEGKLYNENGAWYPEGSQVPDPLAIVAGEQEWVDVCAINRGGYQYVGDAYVWETWNNHKFIDGDDLRNAIIMHGDMALLLDFHARIIMDEHGDLMIQALRAKKEDS